MKQAAGRAGQTHVHMRDAQFDGSVGSLLGEINVVYADDFSAAGVNDLLVEKVLTHGEPAFIRAVVLQLLFFDVQPQDARGKERDVVIARDQREVLSASEQDSSDTVWLVGRLYK